jgi:hypothetical protein
VSFRSPYTVQADIGFFAQHKKAYGAFFCAVQTFTQKIFALPLKNTRSETLMEALGHMLKVSEGWGVGRETPLSHYSGSVSGQSISINDCCVVRW